MNGCLIPPTMAQKSTGKLAPVWGFLHCSVVKQQQCISSLVGFPLENLGTIPVKSPTPHPSLLTNLAELCLPKAPAENLFIDDTRRKKNLPHYILCFSPCPPCQSMSSVQFAIPAIVKFRFILTNFTKGCCKAGGGR